ncbi:Uncharacterised protein [Acinetobacter baumannii]|nr:Uncharacterised protein [Acinetobacter baumannii]
MLSWPPAITASASPLRIACTARCTAFKPEPHTLLMVSAGVVNGSPAFSAVWRAGFCPQPAVSTWPRITSSICCGATPLCASSPCTAAVPSSTAVNGASAP